LIEDVGDVGDMAAGESEDVRPADGIGE